MKLIEDLMMKKWILALAVAFILPACVTINIYFPAAAAEKAADKIIDDVWQLKNGEKPAGKSSEPKTLEPASTPVNSAQ
jgi:starvation-inducible outer membrane lipoprotein